MDKENKETNNNREKILYTNGSNEEPTASNTPESYYAELPLEEMWQPYSQKAKPRRLLWSVVWSDLMMTMFVMFAVLYIYKVANMKFSFDTQDRKNAALETVTYPGAETSKVGARIESVDASSLNTFKKNVDTIRLQNLEDISKVELQEDKAVRVVLPGDLLFDTGRVDLKLSALSTPRRLADAIRTNDYLVNVVGHTDSVPMHSEKFATNWELSANRACAVARFLIEQMKLSPARFYVSGYAYLQPVVPNDTPENYAANRRVEVILTKKKPRAENDSISKYKSGESQ